MSQSQSVDDALALLPAVFDALTGAQWWRVGDDGLPAVVKAVHRAEARAGAVMVAVVGEAVSRGLPTQVGAKDGGAWLRGLVPVTPTTASARGRLAQRLVDEELAPTRADLADGRVSIGHASVTARCVQALAALPEPVDEQTRAQVQALLLDSARRVDPAQLGKAARTVQACLDSRAGERLANDEDAQDRASQLHLHQGDSGMWQVYGALPSLGGAALAAALDPLARPQPASDGSPDCRSAGRRRADALTQLAELALAARSGTAGALPSRGGSPVRIMMSGDLEAFVGRYGRDGVVDGVDGVDGVDAVDVAGRLPAVVETGEPGGWVISPLAAEVAACDGEIVPVLTDGRGRALDVGDTIYPFPPRIRRAIEHRDRHCTFPNCQAPPPWCHAHHLVPFGRLGRPGGPTSEANGALLCGRHHRVVHRRGWRGELIDSRVHWHPPGRGRPDDQDSGTRGVGPSGIGKDERHFDAALRALTRQWVRRRHHPETTPTPVPDDGSRGG